MAAVRGQARSGYGSWGHGHASQTLGHPTSRTSSVQVGGPQAQHRGGERRPVLGAASGLRKLWWAAEGVAVTAWPADSTEGRGLRAERGRRAEEAGSLGPWCG